MVHGAHMVDAAEAALEVDGILVGGIREGLPTLAERFADVGYRTVSLAADHLLSPELGLVRGFEEARIFETDAGVMKAAFAEIEREDDRPVLLFLDLMSAHTPYRDGPGPWAVSDAGLLTPAGAPHWARPYLTTEGPPVSIWRRFPKTATSSTDRHASSPASSRFRPRVSSC